MIKEQTMIERCNNIIDDNGTSKCKWKGCSKLEVYNWMKDVPSMTSTEDIVEVQFKSTRKAYYFNINKLNLKEGDIIAVEASPGHDIGVVSLMGVLVELQLKKAGINPKSYEFKKVYRKAKATDIEKWTEAIALEHETMIKARKIANDLKLNMKIGDVEYQGDKTKAIFYYIADERVDFRELIKVLADQFKIRIEMRQIGARQEAGRIGGFGSCGREICCSSWMSNFVSVTTNSARTQELSLNPQKLAGQCGKLKCCLNYELDCYIDARKAFPKIKEPLETLDGFAYHQKTDIFKKIMWFSFDKEAAVNLTPVPVERVREVIEMNKKGKKPDKLVDPADLVENKIDFDNVVGQEDITRFLDDKPKKKKKRPKRRNKSRNPNQRNNQAE
jgi:cell fate regulator YaaT (PSP1 superfamily)